MKKVGIIDYYISNFHSNTYYKLFHEIAVEENREEYCITHVWALVDANPTNGDTTDMWCERTGAVKCASIKEVCDAVDVIMVLAPNNPELHEEFIKIPFESGKPVYVDKTFAPDAEIAKRIADYGMKCGTKFWSSSAVRFDPVFSELLKSDTSIAESVIVQGPNVFEIYSIHIIEIINTIMKIGAKYAKCLCGGSNLLFEIGFHDGRKAFYMQPVKANIDFCAFISKEGKAETSMYKCSNEFWRGFARGLMDFFDTGKTLVPIESTIECIAIRDALIKSMENIGTEIPVLV